MKKLILLLTLIIFALAGCEYPDAGALENNQWIGTVGNPYQGMVSDNFYTWNGTNYIRIPAAGATGAPGSTGATGDTGATGAAGAAGPNSVNSSTTSTNITGLIKGDGSKIELAVPGVDYQSFSLSQGARVLRSNVQGIYSGVWTDVQFNVEVYDTDNIFSSSSNTVLTAKTAGLYFVYGLVYWPSGSTGIRGLAIEKNDAGVYICMFVNYPDPVYGSAEFVNAIIRLEVNDYVKLCAFHSSGGYINLTVSNGVSPAFAMQRIGN